MQACVYQKLDHREQRLHSRRGVISAWSVFALMLAGLCTSLVINQLWLSQMRAEAIRCAEAAALAAGSELLSDDLLKVHPADLENQWRLDRAKLSAIDMSRKYHASAGVPELDESDILFNGTDSVVASSTSTIPASVTVTYGGLRSDGGPKHSVRMFFPGLSGVQQAAIGMHATAKIENQPVAFQAGPGINIPMAPLAIPDDSTGRNSRSWTWLIEQGHGKDQYAWSNDSHTIQPGPDGLPEIQLTFQPNSVANQCGNIIPLNLCNQPNLDPSLLTDWMAGGIDADSLHGGVAAGGPTDRTAATSIVFPHRCTGVALTKTSLNPFADAIASALGRPVLFPITQSETESDDAEPEHDGSSNSTQALTLDRTVAARVMSVRMSKSGQVDIVLQPCVMTTATAIMDSTGTAPSNRYVYRMRLAY
ncbi:MAG: hypothetical protein KDA91_16775 [Planctomycetaceae bacterium]|nr:hypothetical protein [Planctomycetaceae bacterium]